MNTKKILFVLIIVFVLISMSSFVFAQEDANGLEDLEVFGLEAEKLLNLGSGLLAAVLCFLTYTAYTRTKRNKLKFIALAFFLFALKSFMMGSEIFIEEIPGVDPITAILDFAILLSFFYGVLKR